MTLAGGGQPAALRAERVLLRGRRHAARGRAVQVDPLKFKLKQPGTKRLKL